MRFPTGAAPAFATTALPPAHLSPCTSTAEDGSLGAHVLFFLILGITTGGIATSSWMRRRGGSLVRVTSPGTTRKHRGSPQFELRQQNRRGVSTSPCRSLCPSPRHLLHPSPLPQFPHRPRRYRHHLHQCQTPWPRSPRALAVN